MIVSHAPRHLESGLLFCLSRRRCLRHTSVRRRGGPPRPRLENERPCPARAAPIFLPSFPSFQAANDSGRVPFAVRPTPLLTQQPVLTYCCALPWRDPRNLRQVSWCDDCLTYLLSFCCPELAVESCLDFIRLGFFLILR